MLMCSSRHETVEGTYEFSKVILFDFIGRSLEEILRTNSYVLKKKDYLIHLFHYRLDLHCYLFVERRLNVNISN